MRDGEPESGARRGPRLGGARSYDMRLRAFTESTLSEALAMVDVAALRSVPERHGRPPRVLDIACRMEVLLRRLLGRELAIEASGIDRSGHGRRSHIVAKRCGDASAIHSAMIAVLICASPSARPLSSTLYIFRRRNTVSGSRTYDSRCEALSSCPGDFHAVCYPHDNHVGTVPVLVYRLDLDETTDPLTGHLAGRSDIVVNSTACLTSETVT